MASVYDTAKYILKCAGTMSAWRLQKLCYYAQAWSLAWTERELFSEDFEAWSNGPVCPELFREHKGLFMVRYEDIMKGNPEALTDDERDTIDIVLRDYGGMSPYELRELSHSEAPYKDARGDLPDGAPSSRIITKSAMGNYYGSL